MEDNNYESAKRSVEAKRGFYIHVFVYIFVNIGIFALDALTGAGLWFQWTLMGWGLGLLGHAFSVFLIQKSLAESGKMTR